MNKNEEKAVVLGKARFIDFAKYEKWCLTDEAEEFFSVANLWSNCLYALQGKVQGINFSDLFDVVKPDAWYKNGSGKLRREEYYLKPLKKCVEYMELFPEADLSFKLIYENEDKIDIIAFGSKQFIVPKWAITKEYLEDYSNIALSDIRKTKSLEDANTGIIPVGSALSVLSQSDVKGKIDKANSEKSVLQTEMDDIKNAKTDELAVLQAEIEKKVAELEAKKQDLLAKLQEKENELNAKMEKLQQELFMLETEIYSIRCFMGEVVDFIKLRSGDNAPADAPITLFQKMRFLDEELGKLVSVYDFDFDNITLFEKLLQTRDDILDVFCPNDKCVSLVRISKTDSYYAYDEISEMLKEYEVYHGKTIGILIRNGENLYIGWTDDEKISINDDNMFFTPETKTVNEEDGTEKKNTSVGEMVSRYFIFSILQGALQNNKMFTLPDGVTADFTRPSEYIIYSVADTWLTDNRYGTFADMIEKCNSVIKAGDYILALEWNHDKNGERGHSDWRNLTRDVSMYDRGIYQIRLVEENTSKYRSDDWKYYISLSKNNWDYVYRNGDWRERKREARALFRVYTDEFINLTYMNSTWLKYVITTQNLGGRHRLSHFAETVRYLNDALKFVKERETEEAKYLSQYVEITDDMWVALSEWKLSKGVRVINDYQAKRFAKFINNRGN